MEGNQMKMRETLEFAVQQLLDATESNEYGNDVVYLVGCMRTVAAACRAALAEPARNCDLFGGDPKMLNTAWFDWTASPSGHDANGVAKMTFAGWLLSKQSTKKEGCAS